MTKPPKKKQKSSSAGVPKRFTCDICGKMFKYPYNVANHRRVHNGEEPYVCKYGCDMRFRWLTSKKNHERHHEKAAEQGVALFSPKSPEETEEAGPSRSSRPPAYMEPEDQRERSHVPEQQYHTQVETPRASKSGRSRQLSLPSIQQGSSRHAPTMHSLPAGPDCRMPIPGQEEAVFCEKCGEMHSITPGTGLPF
eukprot:Plantae.Rhodophyta-Purpureofilum_apyrenoidigerum.ctg629.p1 GENE.Plantae.Rhodophyta-Purpureofilum_apyrenoidigerum.ctg629~~Plantae.Rhodophyta-Purpureofilum_apyrenoidigerum.ctg629.p1  ORF type:complete len:195 (+),score=15.48 Plantae.Rhodophyta-Purpureofilum_apyrenoidigerum.ctg629:61-645(+)